VPVFGRDSTSDVLCSNSHLFILLNIIRSHAGRAFHLADLGCRATWLQSAGKESRDHSLEGRQMLPIGLLAIKGMIFLPNLAPAHGGILRASRTHRVLQRKGVNIP
jgi:hypothetical protein